MTAKHRSRYSGQSGDRGMRSSIYMNLCGPTHGIPTESLAYVEIRNRTYPSHATLLSVDAEICHGPRLCLRIQNWTMLKDFKPSSLDRIYICAHLDSDHAPIAELIQSEWDTCKSLGHKLSNPHIHQCPGCGIDYQMEVIDCGRKRNAWVITKWLDLGSGPDPNDPRWERHPSRYGVLGKTEINQSDETPRSHFEQKSAVSLDALPQRNALLLKREVFLMNILGTAAFRLQGIKAMADYRKDRSYYMYLP